MRGFWLRQNDGYEEVEARMGIPGMDGFRFCTGGCGF
jgi:hypothetical protein